MAPCNAQAPGLRHPQPMGRGLSVPGIDDSPNNLAPSRMRARNPGPCLQGIDPPLRFPNSWPQCLGRRSDSPAVSLPTKPDPSLSPTSSDTESTSVGLPSLESITGPESGYEASSSSKYGLKTKYVTNTNS